MSENKQIKIAFAVDDRSITNAKRSLTEILNLVERIAKTMGGIGGAGGATRGTPFSFLSGVGIGGAPRPGGGGKAPDANSIGSVFAAQAKGLKEVAKASTDTSKTMAQDLRRAVDEQRRALKDLDDAVDTASKRFKQLKSSQQDLMSSMTASGASPEQARAYTASQISGQEDYVNNLKWRRSKARQGLKDSQSKEDEFYESIAERSEGGHKESLGERYGRSAFGRRFPIRDPQGRLFRAGVVGGAAAGGIVAGANEYQTQFFDTISNEARQAQAFGSIGTSTRNGDLTYIAAAMQIMRDPDKRKELAELAKSTGSQSVVGGAEGLFSIFGGNAGAVGSAIRGFGNTDTPLKEKMRSYMDQQIQSDPEFFDKLSKFQNEAGMRVQTMRRLGFSSKSLSDVRIAAGEDEGLVNSAFESVRGGGFKFAQKNLFSAISAGRAGLNVGDIGSFVAANAATAGRGGINELLRSVRVDLDPVAAEALAKGVAAGINSALFGAVSGMGLVETMRFGMNNMNPEEQARNMRTRMGSLGGVANVLGGMDGAGHAINLLTAHRVAGPGADIFQTNAMMHMMNDPTTLAAIARGDVPPALAAQGITPEMARDMVSSTTSWRAQASFFNQGQGTRLTPASKRMKDLAENYGGDIKKYLTSFSGAAQKNAISELASAYTANTTFKDQDTAETYLSFIAGIGAGPVKKGKFQSGDAAHDSPELKQARDAAKNNEENYKNFVTTNEQFLKEISGLTQRFGETFTHMGKLSTNADMAAKSLQALADAADKFILKTGGKPPERKGADQKEIRQTQLDNEGKLIDADQKVGPKVLSDRKEREETGQLPAGGRLE